MLELSQGKNSQILMDNELDIVYTYIQLEYNFRDKNMF